MAADPEGGFSQLFVEKNPAPGELTPKLGYARASPAWDWVIGTGIYLDDIESVLNKGLNKFKQRIMTKIVASLCLFGFALLLLYFNSSILSKRIHKGIDQFRLFFERAVTSHEKNRP